MADSEKQRLTPQKNYGSADLTDEQTFDTNDISRFANESPKAMLERSSFTILAFSLQLILIILFAIAVEYPSPLSTETENVSNYVYMQQVNVMMFIGFGFLMTFLRRYGYGAITLNMILTVLCIQWGMFMMGLVDVLFTDASHKLSLGVDNIAQGDIAAATILISFGAILGRATPSQLLVMAFLEIIIYSLNSYVVTNVLMVTDVGGSIVIHTFGAYFGLAVSKMLGPPSNEHENASEYHADLFSMVGTLFLWLYWPSFNGIFPNAVITDEQAFSFSQTRAFVNTLLSLCSCTVCTVALSMFFKKGKIDMVHIQNSTLAGGVAVGAAANLYLTPAGAMAVGLFAACLSVTGFEFVSDFLQETLGVYDTCGVHNLHGMPGILGGIVSAIAIGGATTSSYPDANVSFYYDTFSRQAGLQVVAVIVTVAIASCGGAVVGWILTKLNFSTVRFPYLDKEFFVIHKD